MEATRLPAPRHDGEDADFELLRAALARAGFAGDSLPARLGIRDISRIGTVDFATLDRSSWPPDLAVLVEAFLVRGFVEPDRAERALGAGVVETLERLGLWARGFRGRDAWHATCLAYPVDDLLLVSDRHDHPDGSPFIAPPDVVFPGAFAGTLRFLELLPERDGRTALDVGTGTGVAAFVLARRHEHVVATDINERAILFTRFNARLNDIRNVEALCGDGYAPVAGRRFDVVVAHPPYVPSLQDTATWRDAGETGERLLHALVTGLPAHLAEGGEACFVATGLDAVDAPLESRARDWLGEGGSALDLLLAAEAPRSPSDALRGMLAHRSDLSLADVAEMTRRLVAAGAVAMVHGALSIRRPSDATGQPLTLRTRLSDETRGRDLSWALRFARWRRRPEAPREFLQWRPRLAPGALLDVAHALRDGRFVPVAMRLRARRPFLADDPVEPAVLRALPSFSGTSSVEEIHAAAVASGVLPEGVGMADFAALVAVLVERGYLEADQPRELAGG